MNGTVVQGQRGSETETVRISATIKKEQAAQLEDLAHEKQVSVAWVVRDAIRQYLKQQVPGI